MPPIRTKMTARKSTGGGGGPNRLYRGAGAAAGAVKDPNPKRVMVFPDVSDLEKGLTELLRRTADDVIKQRGKFYLGISGDSMTQHLSVAIPKVYNKGSECWKKWHIFFCDERIVGFDDKESIFGGYKADLLKKIPELEAQIEKIDPSKDAEENARLYHDKLVQHFGNDVWPSFDLVLLGMGPDGHTCSLFPDHPLLRQTGGRWVLPITDSPKPPPARITLAMGVLNNAHAVAFVIAGSNKADTVKHILEEGNSKKLPAGMVKPEKGQLTWMLDKEASANLQKLYVVYRSK